MDWPHLLHLEVSYCNPDFLLIELNLYLTLNICYFNYFYFCENEIHTALCIFQFTCGVHLVLCLLVSNDCCSGICVQPTVRCPVPRWSPSKICPEKQLMESVFSYPCISTFNHQLAAPLHHIKRLAEACSYSWLLILCKNVLFHHYEPIQS